MARTISFPCRFDDLGKKRFHSANMQNVLQKWIVSTPFQKSNLDLARYCPFVILGFHRIHFFFDQVFTWKLLNAGLHFPMTVRTQEYTFIQFFPDIFLLCMQ